MTAVTASDAEIIIMAAAAEVTKKLTAAVATTERDTEEAVT
jgi:hypothetical protein